MKYPNLLAEMGRRGLTRKALCDCSGISPGRMYPILAGKRDMTIADAQKIRDAAFPDMRLDYLFGEEDGK